jgi:DNA mismatch endonuclease (patch repair protein)
MRYDRLRPASAAASTAARGASKKKNTEPELVLRRALRDQGLRTYRIDVPSLKGRPDVVFVRERVAVFCDGDFWHGRNLEERIAKLEQGHNAPYWIEKIRGNVARDRQVDAQLESDGWSVLRFWETDVKRDAVTAAKTVAERVRSRRL